MFQKIFTLVFILFFTKHLQSQIKYFVLDSMHKNPNEPSLIINPSLPNEIIGGANINYLYTSKDTGKSFETKILKSPLGVYGDPVLYANNFGTVFYAHLSANKSKKYPEWFDKIVIHFSTDGFNNYSNGTAVGENGDKVQDKHWLVTNNFHNRKYHNRLIVSWTEFDKYNSADKEHKSRIRVAYSDNYLNYNWGNTISDTEGNCMDGDSTMEGATCAFISNGRLFAMWSGLGNIYLDQSFDGGETWGIDKILTKQEGGWAHDVKGIMRTNGLPFLVADDSRSKYINRLYAVWAESNKYGKPVITYMISKDSARSWSQEKTFVVNHKKEKGQFTPHICIDRYNGNVYMVYYQITKTGKKANVMLAVSKNGGETFSLQKINQKAITLPGKDVFFGDYISVSGYKNKVVMAWTEGYGKKEKRNPNKKTKIVGAWVYLK